MSEKPSPRLGTISNYLTPSDVKTWVAALSALGAGAVAFVQSDRWELAIIVAIGVAVSAALAILVVTRLRSVEEMVRLAREEVAECRVSHLDCDKRVASAHTAIAVMHTRLAAHDPTLPRLRDLLGPDAMDALLRAGDAQQMTNLRQQ